MNWKKILLFGAAAAASGGLVPWLQSATSGHPIPFTFGTVGVPAVLAIAQVIVALFTKPPHQ